MKEISLGISNYYGTVYAIEDSGEFYLELENYSGSSRKEISEELFRAIQKEFK